ncbi:MAG: hypothetical protein WC974_08505 [Thermoplasmata archaeon]
MKINGLKVVGDCFAYDGCHKIYVLESEKEKVEAANMGYSILSLTAIKKVYRASCRLKFINNWSLTTTYAEQGRKAEFKN